MTEPTKADAAAKIERALEFMRHGGLCALIGGYGYCSCGFDEAKADALAVASHLRKQREG